MPTFEVGRASRLPYLAGLHPDRRQSRALRFLLALAVVGAASLLRLAVDPFVHEQMPVGVR